METEPEANTPYQNHDTGHRISGERGGEWNTHAADLSGLVSFSRGRDDSRSDCG